MQLRRSPGSAQCRDSGLNDIFNLGGYYTGNDTDTNNLNVYLDIASDVDDDMENARHPGYRINCFMPN